MNPFRFLLLSSSSVASKPQLFHGQNDLELSNSGEKRALFDVPALQ